MTSREFRDNGPMRDALLQLLQNEVLQEAIACVRASDELHIPDGDASARLSHHDRRQGKLLAFSELWELCEANPIPRSELPMTFGTPHDASAFDDPPINPEPTQ